MATSTTDQVDSGWGSKHADHFVPTLHHAPYAAIDPSTAHLPRPFTAVIIGASRGIGAGVAAAYAAAGASGLVLASRRRSGLEETAERCKKVAPTASPPEIEIIECDITSSDAVSSLAERVRQKFGHVDVVVINSGYSGPVVLSLTETDVNTFRAATEVNYIGTFLVAKYLLPLLKNSPWEGKALVAVSSVGAFIVRGPIANAQYCVSKAAQVKLLECVHEQVCGEGIAVYAVHPGAVRTEMAEETAPEEFMEYLTDSPDLCGAACVWLTKDGKKREWLSGRFVSALWDVEELEAMREEIVQKDLLKMGISL